MNEWKPLLCNRTCLVWTQSSTAMLPSRVVSSSRSSLWTKVSFKIRRISCSPCTSLTLMFPVFCAHWMAFVTIDLGVLRSVPDYFQIISIKKWMTIEYHRIEINRLDCKINWAPCLDQPSFVSSWKRVYQPPLLASSRDFDFFFLICTSKVSNEPCCWNMRFNSSPQ